MILYISERGDTMGRKQFAKGRTVYNANRDIGLYVISDNDLLMENVNNELKRKGIIGVTDRMGNVRYYIDGRKGLETTANQLKNVVEDFEVNGAEKASEEFAKAQLYDAIAHEIFFYYDFDFSLIGSNILYAIVRDILEEKLSLNDSLKEICAFNEDEFGMNYSQMVRNLRYSLSNSNLHFLKTRIAIRKLALEIRDTLNARAGIQGIG